MSTRGLQGFVTDGVLRAQYNHSDSYPGWLGKKTLEFAFGLNDEEVLEQVRARTAQLVGVNEQARPTPEQAELVKQWSNADVGEGDDWYAALRETQGNWRAILDSGFILNSRDFGRDATFCEWGWVLDLDEKKLEVYSGYPQADGPRGSRRWPNGITLVRTIPFSEIPSPTLDAEKLDALVEELEQL